MTTSQHRGPEPAAVDDLAEAEAEFAAAPRLPRNPPRWVRWTVVPLLVLVPMGYVAVSAAQSRGSGEDAIHEQAAAGSPRCTRPSSSSGSTR